MILPYLPTNSPFDTLKHFDPSLDSVTKRWLDELQRSHPGIRFAARPTSVSGQSDISAGRSKREREFAIGRRCASQLLADLNEFRPVGVNEDRSPAWPTGTVGSISHSNRWTIACVASTESTRSAGVDTEPIVSAETSGLILNDVTTANEMKLVQAVGFNKQVALTLIFSAKESFYKCWHPITKRFLEFRDVAVVDATATTLFLRGSERTSNQHSELAVSYSLTDHDVFTFACLENVQ